MVEVCHKVLAAGYLEAKNALGKKTGIFKSFQ